MKLISIQASGLPLFKEDLHLRFYASQRVQKDALSNLYQILPNVYLNNAIGIIGINASGKTTVLRVIDFVLHILNNDSLNHVESRTILDGTEKSDFKIVFINNQEQICLLNTVISPDDSFLKSQRQYCIVDEQLYVKPAKSVKRKKDIADFSGCRNVINRKDNEEFLSDDVSIVISMNRKYHDHIFMTSLLQMTDVNELGTIDNVSDEIIHYLDPSIESIRIEHVEGGDRVHLHFKEKEEILLNDIEDLNRYLSSGTIKGIRTFNNVISVLQYGGYVLVDEIEDHFNHEIVATLVRFFMDPEINPHGASLIFSTHYPELLDEFDRNDSIYIIRNQNGITAENLSDILHRNDIKKSEAYQSGYLEGTVPMYESYLELKKKIQAAVKKEA